MPKLLSEVIRHFTTLRAYAASIGLTNALKLRTYDLVSRSCVVPLPPSVSMTLSNALYPLKMRTGGSSDRLALHQIFIEEEYEPLALSHPTAILDLGANVGYSSAYFLSKYPTARVVAVEPDSTELRALLPQPIPVRRTRNSCQRCCLAGKNTLGFEAGRLSRWP